MSDLDRQIIYLSYDGLTDPLGQSQILPYLIGLSQGGHKFIAVTFEKQRVYESQRSVVEAQCHNHQITWIPLRYHKWPPVLSTIYDLWILRRRVKNIIKRNKISIIHCRSYITSLVGFDMKRKKGVKFIFDMRGFWADERVEGGLWNLENPLYHLIYNFFKKKERQFLREADQVICLTHNAKSEIESWSIGNPPIAVIPTCVDLDLFDRTKINEELRASLREKLNIKAGDFVLLYLGSWGTWYKTTEMLHFFSRLKEVKPEAKFLLVTSDKINVENYVLKKDVIITQAPRSLVPLHISLADVSVCFIKTSYSKKASSATKLGEVMALGVPIITNEGWGDVSMIFGSGNKDHLMDDFSQQAFDKVISKLFSPGLSVLQIDMGNYALSKAIRSYTDIYARILDK